MTDDPFEVLGLPPKFDLDAAAVQRAYLAKAAGIHPDLAFGAEDADIQSAAINRAKAILADGERRANALLERLGGPGKSVDKSLPAGFLMDIMETREAIEAALATKDPGEREKWEAWAQGQREKYAERVGRLFDGLGDSRDPKTLRAIRQELNAWRYIERLIEQLDPQYDPARQDFAD